VGGVTGGCSHGALSRSVTFADHVHKYGVVIIEVGAVPGFAVADGKFFPDDVEVFGGEQGFEVVEAFDVVEDGFGDLLGSADAVILDEAHALPDLATQFFGQQFGSRQVETLLNESRAAVQRAGFSVAELASVTAAVGAALQAALQSGEAFESAALALAAQLREYGAALASLPTESAFDTFATRATALADSLERIALASEDEGAKTLERSVQSFSLRLLPFDISARFLAMMEARPAAWIFTSATLTVGENFAHFAGRLGLLDAQSLSIPSPFDYANQALLYLPSAMPEPMSEGYVAAVIEASLPLLEASGGGAFLLFTSHRALAQGAQLLRARWDGAAIHPILVQGEGPREKLLREFREHGSAVLLGTASFWEGVDVKGDALRLVVIEKLPFASPDDPLTKARIDHLRRRGGNPFKEYQLPEAVLALKQGVGRLIRSETDRGVIAICDPRLIGKSYGRVFVASLPEMPVTRELGEARKFLARVTSDMRSTSELPLTRDATRGRVHSS
jgi:ATP-dependent DNA helicase DinG